MRVQIKVREKKRPNGRVVNRKRKATDREWVREYGEVLKIISISKLHHKNLTIKAHWHTHTYFQMECNSSMTFSLEAFQFHRSILHLFGFGLRLRIAIQHFISIDQHVYYFLSLSLSSSRSPFRVLLHNHPIHACQTEGATIAFWICLSCTNG